MQFIGKYGFQLAIAIILWLLLWLSIPLKFDKYLLTYAGKDNISGTEFLWADMDGLGSDECISCCAIGQIPGNIRNGCSMNKTKGVTRHFPLDQINIKGELSLRKNAFTADANRNGISELYILEATGTDIWLNGYEYPNFSTPFLKTRIDSFIPYKGKPDYSVEFGFCTDVNRDSTDELYFFIRNSYFIYPRKLYRLDIKTEKLIASPSTCIELVNPEKTISNTGELLITGQVGCSNNYKDSLGIPYSDNYSYIFLLDSSLNFKFDPIAFATYPYGTTNIVYKDHLFVAALNKKKRGELVAAKLTLNGDFIDSTTFLVEDFALLKHNGKLLLRCDSKVHILKENLSRELLVDLNEKRVLSGMFLLDLDDDSLPEIVFETSDNELGVIASDYSAVTYLERPVKYVGTKTFSVQRFQKSTSTLVEAHRDQVFHYRYESNKYYWLKFPYLLALGILSSLVSFISFGLFKKSLDKRHAQEKELGRLQMLTIKNQVDPHFTLNALNNIDFMYRNNQADKASKYMVKLSRLMHESLMHSEEFTCTLYVELDFIRTYCELEENRAEYPFTYQINVAEDINPFEVIIPRNILFTYVENSIKHGIRPKKDAGQITIDVQQKNGYIVIVISDDGIGIGKSKELKTTGTGRGLEIIEQIIRLYKKLSGKTIKTTTQSDEHGTTVIIKLTIKRSQA